MSTTATIIIGQALADLGVIRPGEVVSATVLADCLARLNLRIGAHSIEQLLAQTQVHASYSLQANVVRYTFGVGGVFATDSRPQKISAWRATGGIFTSGGSPLTFDEFDAAAEKAVTAFAAGNVKASALEAEMVSQVGAALAPFHQVPAFTFPALLLANAAVPLFLGADAASPLIQVAVFPPPGATPGTLELSYWIALTQFADLTTAYTFPDGWYDFLHFDLALALHPRYGRQGFDATSLTQNAGSARAKIQTLNAPAAQQ